MMMMMMAVSSLAKINGKSLGLDDMLLSAAMKADSGFAGSLTIQAHKVLVCCRLSGGLNQSIHKT